MKIAYQPKREPDPASLRRAAQLHEEGIRHARANQWKRALAAFREAVQLAPHLPHLNFRLGVALCRADRFDEAIEAFQRELLFSRDHGPATAEIGTCYARTGRAAKGIPYLERGLKLLPNQPLAQYSLGLALLTENRRREAIAALDRALVLDASYAEAYRTRGLALAMDGQFDKAVEDMRAAAALSSDNSRAIIDLGLMFGRAERDQQAGRLFEAAAKAAPRLALAQYYYGHFLINHKRFQEGLDYIDNALELDPLHTDSHVARGFGYLGQGRIEDAVAAFRQAGKLKPDNAPIAGTLLFALQHKPGVTESELLTEHKKWARLYRRGVSHDRLLFDNDPDPRRRPRLGIVSADMHRHAAAFLTLTAFEQLTGLGFEIVCFKTDRKRVEDDVSDRFKAIALEWRDISDLDDAAAITQIMSDKIDVLFDLSGHTAGNRLGVFERRAAPIQLGWAGYVGTVGLDTYEGIIADRVEIPHGHDGYYTEPVIRLPDCYVSYLPPIGAPAVGQLPCISRDQFTFGCFNRPAKLNEAVARTWKRILDQVPSARVLMIYGGLQETSTREAVLGVLARCGIDTGRVELVGEFEQSKLLQGYNQVDLALDPFPYSGGVTTLEAMWMGVPVVTLTGGTFAGRHSASHLTAAGLTEFCTTTEDQYVSTAVAWAGRRDALAALRATLRERVASSPLCDAGRFAGHLSAELNRLWQGWCSERRARADFPERIRPRSAGPLSRHRGGNTDASSEQDQAAQIATGGHRSRNRPLSPG
uniref:protein O-GlcNAc transferase n=1 Tax=Rhodopseudomonas palustris (strain BisA53) TaxID=316055 RepID=Q07N75_RHOP5